MSNISNAESYDVIWDIASKGQAISAAEIASNDPTRTHLSDDPNARTGRSIGYEQEPNLTLYDDYLQEKGETKGVIRLRVAAIRDPSAPKQSFREYITIGLRATWLEEDDRLASPWLSAEEMLTVYRPWATMLDDWIPEYLASKADARQQALGKHLIDLAHANTETDRSLQRTYPYGRMKSVHSVLWPDGVNTVLSPKLKDQQRSEAVKVLTKKHTLMVHRVRKQHPVLILASPIYPLAGLYGLPAVAEFLQQNTLGDARDIPVTPYAPPIDPASQKP